MQGPYDTCTMGMFHETHHAVPCAMVATVGERDPALCGAELPAGVAWVICACGTHFVDCPDCLRALGRIDGRVSRMR